MCPLEEFGRELVHWKCYEKTIVTINEATREARKKIVEVYKETSCREFLSYLIPNIKKFIKHNYVACW
jgi:hypothetical protein